MLGLPPAVLRANVPNVRGNDDGFVGTALAGAGEGKRRARQPRESRNPHPDHGPDEILLCKRACIFVPKCVHNEHENDQLQPRRVNLEHRLVYRVTGKGDAQVVEVAQCRHLF